MTRTVGVRVSFELDGEQVAATTRPDTPLRELLRAEFEKTGVKVGCESGRCGVCTVLLDGDPVKSCLVPAPKVEGRAVTTVHGLGGDEELTPVQDVFVEQFATQCGYCTPGFVVAATAFVTDAENPSRGEIESALKGNVCRCTGYERIVDAVEAVATDDRDDQSDHES